MNDSKSDKRQSRAKVPLERPDPHAAEKPPGAGAKDRPGFDLGGAKEKPEDDSQT